jgi:hypothetical protein
MFPWMIEMIMRIIAAGVMTYPPISIRMHVALRGTYAKAEAGRGNSELPKRSRNGRNLSNERDLSRVSTDFRFAVYLINIEESKHVR